MMKYVFLYSPVFEDETHPELKHTGAGILSMANRSVQYSGTPVFKLTEMLTRNCPNVIVLFSPPVVLTRMEVNSS